jgi:hypothetical protein
MWQMQTISVMRDGGGTGGVWVLIGIAWIVKLSGK